MTKFRPKVMFRLNENARPRAANPRKAGQIPNYKQKMFEYWCLNIVWDLVLGT